MKSSLDKRNIIRAFNYSAETYDQAADIQKIAGIELLSHINIKKCDRNNIVDLGSGTGFTTQQIKKQISTPIIAIDIAAETLAHSNYSTMKNVVKICSDMDKLPLQHQSIDTIISNLAFQWSLSLHSTLKECHRVLKPHSQLYFSIIGPNTLRQIRDAWKSTDDQLSPSAPLEASVIKKILSDEQFDQIQIYQKNYDLEYPNAAAFLQRLKAIGCTQLHKPQHQGLIGKKKFSTFLYHLEQQPFYATYEVIYVCVRKH